MRRTILAAALLLGGVARAQTAPPAAVTPAAITPDALIATRQAGFQLMAATLPGLKAAVEAKADVKPLADAARALAAWGAAIPAMFPAGTESGHHTHARPEIWSDRAGFERAAAGFTTDAETLAKLADAGDQAGFAAQFKTTAQACGACHRAYRAKD